MTAQTTTTTTGNDDVVQRARLALDDAFEEHPAEVVPCRRHPLLFTSERAVKRTRAAVCQGCPVLLLCRSYSDRAGESWHLWAERAGAGE